jgi:membrane fusion protein
MKANPAPVRWMGEILLAQPLSTSYLAWLSVLLCAAVITALFTVDYTRKERVTGQLTLDKGMVKIYAPPVTGVVTQKLVKEGDTVLAGQALFAISVERASSTGGDTQAQIVRQIAQRRQHLSDEREKINRVMMQDEVALQQRIAFLRQRIVFLEQEIKQLVQEIDTQTKRYRLSQSALARSRELLKQDFVSQARVDELEQDTLDQQQKLQNAQRQQTMQQKDLTQFNSDLSTWQSDLRNMPLTRQNRLSEVDRQLLALDQETVDTESKRELVVNAPQAGQVTTILFEVGQTVQAEKPLAALLPSHSKLQASIYLPSRAYGFIEKNQAVLMRYPAYPYQKFGQYGGKVLEVGRTALSIDELKAAGQVMNEPFYRVLVELESQSIQAYGKPITLQDGLQVEADILIDTRKLYEWVLEPLYSVTGKL